MRGYTKISIVFLRISAPQKKSGSAESLNRIDFHENEELFAQGLQYVVFG